MKYYMLFVAILSISFYNVFAQETSHELMNSKQLEDANIRFEQNATDGDVEVVFELKGGDEGITNLTIVSPAGKLVGEFNAPDVTTLGIRQFRLESPEPKDVDGLKSAYPEGIYKFSAVSTNGEEFYSEAKLSHILPEVVSIINPEPEAEGVSINNLVIKWAQVKGVAGYFIELDDEDSGANLQIKLPEGAHTFFVPEEFLKDGTEYILSIGTVSEEGNVSVVETSFTTE